MSRKQIIYTIIFILITLFIFSNSLQNAAESSEQSGRIVSIAMKIMNSLNISVNKDYLTHIIRKVAHLTEFTIQSFALSGIILNFKSNCKKQIIIILLIGLLTACTDEFLQLFSSGRSCEIKDILIDFSGTVIGMNLYKIIKKIVGAA